MRSRTFDDVKREWESRRKGRFLLVERTFCADKGQNEDKSEDIADPYSPRRCTNDGSGSFSSIRLIERIGLLVPSSIRIIPEMGE